MSHAHHSNDAVIDIRAPEIELQQPSMTASSPGHYHETAASAVTQSQSSEDAPPMARLSQMAHDRPLGYPQLAEYVNSNEDHLIFRKFGFLRCRVMLYCQQELTSLEEELVGMDKVDDDDSEECLRSVKADERRKLPLWRKQLLQQIKDKLFEYDRLVSQSRTYLACSPPKARSLTSWATHILTNIPLKSSDMSFFLEESADLVSLATAQERSSLDNLIECVVDWCTKRNVLHWFTLSPARRAQTDARCVSFLIRNKVDLIVRIVLVVVVVGLLSTPMVVLPHAHNSTTLTFLVVTLYTIVFSICLSATTRARRQDHFAICAAYSAVLLIFPSATGLAGS